MPKFQVAIDDKKYQVDAPDSDTAWAWANDAHSSNQTPKIDEQKPKDYGWEEVPGKALRNFAPDVAGQIGGIVQAVTHPIDTAKSTLDLAAGELQKALPESVNKAIAKYEFNPEAAQQSKELAGVVNRELMQRYGTSEGFKKAIAEHPASVLADIGAITTGGGALATKIPQLSAAGKLAIDAGRFATGASTAGILPLAKGAYSASKAGLLDPMINQEKVLAGGLVRASGENESKRIIEALKTAQQAKTQGVDFSTGTLLASPSLSAIEDYLITKYPSGELANKAGANRSALAKSLRDIGKDEEAMNAAETLRDETARELYKQAGQESVTITPQLTAILRNPSVKRAASAEDISPSKLEPYLTDPKGNVIRNTITGQPIPNQINVDTLHQLKLGLDKASNFIPSTASDNFRLAKIKRSKSLLLDEIGSQSQNYDLARLVNIELSKPINQMQVGNYAYNKLVPSTSGENPTTLNASQLATALRNPDAMARLSTGYKGATLENMLTPEQLQTVKTTSQEASKIAESEKMGKGTQSATARRLGTQDLFSKHFEENAPITSKVLNALNRTPYVGWITSGAKTLSGTLGGARLEESMMHKLDDMLANNPQQVGLLIENELKNLHPSERQLIMQALPESLFISASGHTNNQ